MSIYFQRERRDLEDVIEVDGKVLFDVPIQSSESLPVDDPDNPSPSPLIPDPDFQYHPDGSIDLFRASTFIAGWNFSGLTGMSTDGQVFQLKKRDYEAEALDPQAGEIWEVVGNSTNAFKVSAFSGMTILLVSEHEILDYGKATVALFNESDAPVILSRHPHTKAGILLFGIGPVDSDITNLYRYVRELYEFISYSDIYIYNAYSYPFYYPTSGTGNNPSPATIIPLNQSPHTRHYQIGVIWSGFTYNFWLIAPTNHAGFTIPNNQDIFFLRAQDFEPLQWYQGQTTYGTLWIDDGSYTAFPIKLDNRGIYINLSKQMPGVMNMKFTQTLILTPPDSSLSAP